jgi:hypothetical protein
VETRVVEVGAAEAREAAVVVDRVAGARVVAVRVEDKVVAGTDSSPRAGERDGARRHSPSFSGFPVLLPFDQSVV